MLVATSRGARSRTTLEHIAAMNLRAPSTIPGSGREVAADSGSA